MHRLIRRRRQAGSRIFFSENPARPQRAAALEAAAPRIRRKLVPVTPNDIDDQPDHSTQNQKRSDRKQQPDASRHHRLLASNRGTGGHLRLSRRNGHIAANRGIRPHHKISAQRSHIARNSPVRIHRHRSKESCNIAPHIAVNPHRTESARNIAGRLSVRDHDVSSKPNAILRRVSEAEGYYRDQQSSSEEQSTHGRPRGLVYGDACLRGTLFSKLRPLMAIQPSARKGNWMLPLRYR
jgi:hypothetical protein